jgi:hypothetical protein
VVGDGIQLSKFERDKKKKRRKRRGKLLRYRKSIGAERGEGEGGGGSRAIFIESSPTRPSLSLRRMHSAGSVSSPPPRFGRAKLRSETGEKNEGRFLTRCEKSSSVSLEFRACSRAISVLSRDSARSSENGNIFGDSGGSGTRRHSTNSPLIRRNVWPAGSAVVVAYGGRKTRVRMGFYEFTSPPCNPLVWRSQCE